MLTTLGCISTLAARLEPLLEATGCCGGGAMSSPSKKFCHSDSGCPPDRPRSHSKCVGKLYAHSKPGVKMHDQVQRLLVPEDKISWDVAWSDYQPPEYTAEVVKKQPVWADPDIETDGFHPKFNQVDGRIDRTSFCGTYDIVDRKPRNPVGRTGLCGRGILGKWGPNHAADPIVTRWKWDDAKKIVKHPDSGKPILDAVLIKRSDTGDWALPGGMVDAGEVVSATLKREFGEEALNHLKQSDADREKSEKLIEQLFKEGTEVYKGYVDDPRNTDQAWMETVAINFHDEQGQAMGQVRLEAGDDAVGVQWHELGGHLQLYASHGDIVRRVAELRGAHW